MKLPLDGKQFEIMDKLAPVAPPTPPPQEANLILKSSKVETIPKDHVRCACNKKVIHFSEVQHYNTGVVAGASDSMCQECIRMVPQHALIVCITCKAVVARVAPHRTKSGFEFKARTFYHTNACPGCKPGLASSVLIEKELFDRQRRK